MENSKINQTAIKLAYLIIQLNTGQIIKPTLHNKHHKGRMKFIPDNYKEFFINNKKK